MTQYQGEKQYGRKRLPRRSKNHLAANSVATRDAKVNTDYLQYLVGNLEFFTLIRKCGNNDILGYIRVNYYPQIFEIRDVLQQEKKLSWKMGVE